MAIFKEKSIFKSMMVPILIALAFLFWGLMVFYTVGDKEPRFWDFGSIPDVPGLSPYSVERKGRDIDESVPPRSRESIAPQHVDGRTESNLQGEPTPNNDSPELR